MSETDITMPPEALEAAARDLARMTYWGLIKVSPLSKSEDEFVEEAWPKMIDHARAACLAMLRAWPNMFHAGAWLGPPTIILPLPTKKETSA